MTAEGIALRGTFILARNTDPDTSHDAAAQVNGRRRETMARQLLAVFAICPLTAEEAADACDFTADDGAWRRVSDLVNAGLLTNTDRRHRARSGRDQLVREITQAGRDALR